MSSYGGGFYPLVTHKINATSGSVTVDTLEGSSTGYKLEVHYGWPLRVCGWGITCVVAPADSATLTLYSRPVPGSTTNQRTLGTILVPSTAIAGSVWLCEQIGDVSTEGIINGHVNQGESLAIQVTEAGASFTFLPILQVDLFRSGTTAVGTGVVKKVNTTNAAGTINHVLV